MNFLDKTINFLAPKWGAERQAYRTAGEIQQTYNMSYDGALESRMSKQWFPSQKQTSLVYNVGYQQIKSMRDRARTLDCNNGLAEGIASTHADMVVGSGFELQVNSGDPLVDAQVHAEWNKFTAQADINGLSWDELQYEVYRTSLIDGDIGTILLKNYQLQVTLADYINNPTDTDTDEQIYGGVSLDGSGATLGYWIDVLDGDDSTSQFIEAKDMILLKSRSRLKQARGVTIFSSSFDLFDQIDKWVEAQLAAARAAACLSIFVRRKNASQQFQNLPTSTGVTGTGSGTGSVSGTGTAQKAARLQSLKPGMIAYLEPEEDIDTVSPTQPAQSFPENMSMMLRFLGRPHGLPLELTMLDFSHTSYYSARAALECGKRVFVKNQNNFSNNWHSRIYRWWLNKMWNDRRLPRNYAMLNHTFIGQAFPYLDYLREVQAQILACDAGFTTEQDVIQGNGGNFADWLKKKVKSKQALEAAGITKLHSVNMTEFKSDEAVPFEEPASPDEGK